ncbi:hypothetical protein F383_26005 [Gossypium arboreum]|uniref:Uncharacterized protein n=1 Tax=Gossypium arboreum TaxID=29729 RepID=A0A0B0NVG9_GOSAR|nr:hypothetical protein F383_26005 [Gossypium arboreum]
MPLFQTGSTRIKYDVITYRCQCTRRGLTREHISEILCHDICILDIPKVHTGLSDVIT